MAPKKLIKTDVVDAVYQKTGIGRKEIRLVIDLFLDEIKSALVKRKCIELRGFGTFEVRIRKGREKARNPKTGTIVSVDSHGIVAFRSGRDLKQHVWNLDEPSHDDLSTVSDPGESGGVEL
ncbi:MAG: HU family DNA-binding protein [Spirochaetaceae bacterium]|jgi:integration host factor subunit beta|nr:HU family DNA-binding protein [Spirochaetaceae bacterium]